jgi:hypothetical protein
MKRWRIAAALVALVLLSACGQSAAQRSSERASASAAAASAAAAQRQAQREARQRHEWQTCTSQTRELRNKLEAIKSRLDVGVNYDDMGRYLGGASIAYHHIPMGKLDGRCLLNVGVPLEAAFNQYVQALNRWRACINDLYCEVQGSVLGEMRRHWTQAGQNLGKVDRVLRSPTTFAAAKSIS